MVKLNYSVNRKLDMLICNFYFGEYTADTVKLLKRGNILTYDKWPEDEFDCHNVKKHDPVNYKEIKT